MFTELKFSLEKWYKGEFDVGWNDVEWIGWLVEFYGISTIVGYLMPNPLLYKWSVLFQTIQFSQTVLIQTIQFNISIVLVHTVKCQNSSIFKKFSLV